MSMRVRSPQGFFVPASGESLNEVVKVRVSKSLRDRLFAAAPDPLDRANWLRSAIAEKLDREFPK
jgi:hypothetical protein